MKRSILLLLVAAFFHQSAIAQNVGIGTVSPNASARLHVETASNGLLINGNADIGGGGVGVGPTLGSGARLFFYPYKSVFRAGTVDGTQWDNANCGKWTTAFGHSTTASGYTSTATGDHTITYGASSFVGGEYNDPILASAQVATTNGTPLLMIGNGNQFTRGNALVTYKTGVTIIQGLSAIDGPILQLVENNVNHFTTIGFYNKDYAGGLNNNWLFQAYPAGLPLTTDRRVVFYTTGGANGGDILTLYGNGNAVLQGTLTQLSDVTMKTNIRPLRNALEKIEAINGYNYKWAEGVGDDHLQAGVIAQEIQKVMPELVSTTAHDKLGVNYNGIIPYLIEGVKELKKQNDELKIENDLLVQRMEKLEKRK